MAPIQDRVRWLVPCLLVLTGCVAPVDAPSAFSTEHYLCEGENLALFDAMVEQCRDEMHQGAPCAGVMSLRGVVDSQAVVADSRVTRVFFADEPTGNGNRMRAIDVTGVAPYFSMRITLYGFEADEGRVPALPLAPPRDVVNFEARGANYLSQIVDQIRVVEVNERDEMRAKVSGRLTRGGTVDMCFHLFR